MNIAPLMTSHKMDWRTPTQLVKKVVEILEEIDLDPCGSSEFPQVIPARCIISPPLDGLSVLWPTGTVYMNPPYGRGIGKWIDVYTRNTANQTVTSGLVLVPARTDTHWWRRLTANAALIAFLWGRLQFNDDLRGAATFPSALILHSNDEKIAGRFVKSMHGIADVYKRA